MNEVEILIRSATMMDLESLVAIEQTCFDSDRLSKRSFRYHLQQENNLLLVVEQAQQLVAYVLIFLRSGTSLARLYSIAVLPSCHGKGIGRQLLEEAEEQCAELGRMFMRLEVRRDNQSAITLYQRMGYKEFGLYADYYEDHADALRLQKRIIPYERVEEHLAEPSQTVLYYGQTTDFTCGSASLMMAMKDMRPDFVMDQRTELQIWREATTIFMTSGHGGCGPHGLAYAASIRGFRAEVYINQKGPLFVEGVRSQSKKQILELVHLDFLEKLAELKVPIHHEVLTLGRMLQMLEQGALPIVLISTYRFDRRKAPHWVLVVDMDEQFVYINDPDYEDDQPNDFLDRHYLPIPKASFESMLQFGQNRLRCTVMVLQ